MIQTGPNLTECLDTARPAPKNRLGGYPKPQNPLFNALKVSNDRCGLERGAEPVPFNLHEILQESNGLAPCLCCLCHRRLTPVAPHLSCWLRMTCWTLGSRPLVPGGVMETPHRGPAAGPVPELAVHSPCLPGFRWAAVSSLALQVSAVLESRSCPNLAASGAWLSSTWGQSKAASQSCPSTIIHIVSLVLAVSVCKRKSRLASVP